MKLRVRRPTVHVHPQHLFLWNSEPVAHLLLTCPELYEVSQGFALFCGTLAWFRAASPQIQVLPCEGDFFPILTEDVVVAVIEKLRWHFSGKNRPPPQKKIKKCKCSIPAAGLYLCN